MGLRLYGSSIGIGVAAFGTVGVYGVEDKSTGGWAFPQPKIKTREEIEQERIALGIIPAPIKRIVEKQARRVIAKATKQADASPNRPDPVAWLERHQAQQKAILARELKERQLESRRIAYMTLLRVEVEALMLQRQEEQKEAKRLQDEEDEQIVMLLMEL